MQEAVPSGQGAMAAIIGLDAEAVGKLCEDAAGETGVCEPANDNGGGQIVISGDRPSVERAVDAGAANAAPSARSRCRSPRPSIAG